MSAPTVGSLFAGIGGIDLGFERAGFTSTWQVEINPYCQKVLEKHFPDAKRYSDVRECGAHNLKPVDIIAGGFPCQDISNAGKRAGINGERSGLWREMHRIISELQPRYVLVENVAALLGRGISRVLGDLSEIGYDAEWQVVSAAGVGAPHLRERIWIVAYPQCDGYLGSADSVAAAHYQERHTSSSERRRGTVGSSAESIGQDVADTYCNDGGQGWPGRSIECDSRNESGTGWEICHSAGQGLQNGAGEALGQPCALAQPQRSVREMADAESLRCSRSRQPFIWCGTTQASERQANYAFAVGIGNQWAVEPNVGRVAHGVPARVDRLRALGNAVVPQIPELIAQRLYALLRPACPTCEGWGMYFGKDCARCAGTGLLV